MPKYTTHEAFKGSYLNVATVTEEHGGELVTSVTKVASEMVESDRGKELKLVAHLGSGEQLVLNRGRCQDLEEIFETDDYDEWRGRRSVIVYVDPNVTFGPKKTGGLRIRANEPDRDDGPRRKKQAPVHPADELIDDGQEEDIPF